MRATSITGFTVPQRAALSWAALIQADAPWTDILTHRLSFTEPGWDPLTQLYGSVAAGMAHLNLSTGGAVLLGFAATDEEDAELLLAEWLRLLERPPALRKELPP